MRPPDAGHGFAHDRRDLEIERLKRQLEEARAREGKIRAEERERFSALSAASKRFAVSMRSRMDERKRTQRRLDAQYAVGRVLEECRDLREAAPQVFRVLSGRLGWEAGVLWMLERGALRCRGVWRLGSEPPSGAPDVFGEACRRSVLPRGVGLPGRVWAREEACWAEDVLEDGGYPYREAAAAQGLRCALALPIQDGEGFVGVFELLKKEKEPVEEDAMRFAYLLEQQLGQFVERRRVEEERDRLRRLAEQGQARLLAILQQMPGGVFIAEPGGRISLANENAARIYGREIPSVDECVRHSFSYPEGEPIRRGDHPLDRALAGESVSTEHLVERAEGARGIVNVNTAPVLDEDGRVVAAVQAFQDVSELVEARKAIDEREQRYRTLTTNIPGAVFRAAMMNRRPSMEFVSARIEEITGYPSADFVSDRVRNYRDVIHPDDSPNNEREVWRALERREPYNIEYRILRADGGVRWVNERGSGTFARGGDLLWVDGAIFDVTERRRSEEALRASEGRLQLALEAAQMGTFLWHVEEDRTQADARLLELFGLPDDGEITLAEALAGMIHPDDSAGYAEAVAGATDPAGEGELRAEIRVVHPDGAERWLAITALTHFEGVPRRATRMSGVAADITERKQTEEALLENEEWLGIAQRAAGSGTWEWNLATDEIRWSDEHRALFGFDAQTPITRERWWATVHPEDLPRLEEAGRRCSEGGEEWPEVEYRIRVAGKTRWIDARGRTLRGRAGRPGRILGISVDVTERKRAEEERDRLLAREWVAGAEVAERERISRELHDRVAHSMAVAHQSLQLYGVLAEKDPARAAERLELAKEMTKASLETTRNLSAELRELDAEEDLAEEIRHLLDVSVPAGVRAEFSAEGDETHVPGHVRGQVFLLLREAVRNALAHSGCGSLYVGLDIDPERIVGSVEDDGRGFDAGGGNGGVGLRSMRERAALLDGAFKLDCEPGRGTRVEVSVPLTGRG